MLRVPPQRSAHRNHAQRHTCPNTRYGQWLTGATHSIIISRDELARSLAPTYGIRLYRLCQGRPGRRRRFEPDIISCPRDVISPPRLVINQGDVRTVTRVAIAVAIAIAVAVATATAVAVATAVLEVAVSSQAPTALLANEPLSDTSDAATTTTTPSSHSLPTSS
jgi:hypothetical protein